MIRASSVSTLLLIMCTMHVGRASIVDDSTRRRRRDTVDNCLNNVCHNNAGCFSLADESYYCKCKTGFRGDGVSYCKQWDEEPLGELATDPDFTNRSNSLGAPVISEPLTTDPQLTKASIDESFPIAPVPSDPLGLPPSFFAQDDNSGSPTAPSDAPIPPVAQAPFPIAFIFPIAPVPLDPSGVPPSFFANDDIPGSSIAPSVEPTGVVPPPSRAPHPSPHGQRSVINDSHVLKGPLL